MLFEKHTTAPCGPRVFCISVTCSKIFLLPTSAKAFPTLSSKPPHPNVSYEDIQPESAISSSENSPSLLPSYSSSLSSVGRAVSHAEQACNEDSLIKVQLGQRHSSILISSSLIPIRNKMEVEREVEIWEG